jgi:large subunit ribosomal protein L10
MDRTEKAEYIDALSSRLRAAPLVALADYRGVTVAEINTLRRTLEAKGLEYRVIKNTLARRAIDGTPMAALNDHLAGMTGWIISGEDPVAAAKVIREVTQVFKKSQKFVIKAGYFDGGTLDSDGVDKVADLPSKEQLLSSLLATIQEGPRSVLGVLQAPARDLLYLLKNYESKLSEAAAAE